MFTPKRNAWLEAGFKSAVRLRSDVESSPDSAQKRSGHPQGSKPLKAAPTDFQASCAKSFSLHVFKWVSFYRGPPKNGLEKKQIQILGFCLFRSFSPNFQLHTGPVTHLGASALSPAENRDIATSRKRKEARRGPALRPAGRPEEEAKHMEERVQMGASDLARRKRKKTKAHFLSGLAKKETVFLLTTEMVFPPPPQPKKKKTPGTKEVSFLCGGSSLTKKHSHPLRSCATRQHGHGGLNQGS